MTNDDDDGENLFTVDGEDDEDGEGESLFTQEDNADEDLKDPDNLFAGDANENFEEESEDSEEEEDEGEEDEEEEDEEAGVLFNEDIYSGNKGAAQGIDLEQEETPGFNPTKGHEQEETPGFNPTKGHEQEETPGFNPTKGHEQEETPGFNPTKGHEQEETPGFNPTKGHEQEETPGFNPTKGHEQEETPGFNPTKGHEQEETPGFNPTKGHEQEETPGFNPTKGHEQEETPGFVASDVEEKESRIGKRQKENPQKNKSKSKKGLNKAQEDAATNGSQKSQQAEADKDLKAKHAEIAAKGKKEAMERMAKAKEELERRKKGRKAELQNKDEEKEPEGDEVSTAELLSKITYQVSLDDLEKKLGIQVIPEDRMRLDRQLAKKMREPAIRALLEGAQDEGLTLAMLPRLPRCIREGQLFKVTGANLVRSYPQFFENVQQVVLKLRTEPFFLQESPELDWSIFSCEVLSDSREKTYMQQKQAIKQHAQRYQSNERRVRRRNMIDALYDLIIIKLVHDHNLLSETVELTESKNWPTKPGFH